MKKVAIALALCMVLSTLVGGVALAAAQRLPLYPVSSGSSDNVLPDEPSQGRVVLVNPKGDVTLIIQGNVEGLEPNHFYTVWVRDLTTGYTGDFINNYAPLGYYLLDTFTTNVKGRGHFHLNIRTEDLPSGDYDIQVAINDHDGGDPSVTNGKTVLATVKYTVVDVGS